MKIAFVGCGAAGRPLGAAWLSAGHRLGAVICRTSGADAVLAMGAGIVDGNLDDADVIVFATPDDVLEAAAQKHPLRAEQVALHLSGAHPSTILAPTGARTGSVHPLRAFVGPVDSLADTFFFVEGDDVAEQLARDLSEHVARIEPDRKLLYHAGAAIASNYTVTLLSLARELFMAAGVGEEQARAALVQLTRGAVDNVGGIGLPHALTGPAARGDVDLVRRHLDALDPGMRELYRALLKATIPIAEAKGGAGAEALRALRELAEGA